MVFDSIYSNEMNGISFVTHPISAIERHIGCNKPMINRYFTVYPRIPIIEMLLHTQSYSNEQQFFFLFTLYLDPFRCFQLFFCLVFLMIQMVLIFKMHICTLFCCTYSDVLFVVDVAGIFNKSFNTHFFYLLSYSHSKW